MSRIVISGVGLLSGLGHGAWPTFKALLDGRSIAQRCEQLPPHIDPVDLVRQVGSVSVAQHTTDPTIEMAERAAREALFDAGVEAEGLRCFLGTSKGAIHSLVQAAGQGDRLNPQHACAVALGPCGHLSQQLRLRLGLGEVVHQVAACASSLMALHQARLWLSNGAESAMGNRRSAIVLTADSTMVPMLIHSYRRLGVLAPARPQDYRGLPLDRRRCGFMLAELAAAVVLERVDQVGPAQIELLDTAAACEAHDLVRPSPSMPVLAAVARRILAGRRIGLLHPHAPGTPDHDAVELAAYQRALADSGGRWPDLYACKGALGHGLGAAGLVSLVLACLCARTRRRPPMPWLAQPLDSPMQIRSVPDAVLPRPPAQAVFAVGFGGHVAAALIQRR